MLNNVTNYILVSDEDYDALPQENDLKWVASEEVARSNQLKWESTFREDSSYEALRLQYMAVVSAAAVELGIDDVYFSGSIRDVDDSYYAFVRDVQMAATRIRLRHSGMRNPETVKISEDGRNIIRAQTRKLISIIEGSQISDRDKRRYVEHAENIISEMDRPRVSLAKATKLVGSIAFGVAVGTSAIADAPAAISTIMGVLGVEKQAEQEQLSLPSYNEALLALPSPEHFKAGET